MTIKINPVDVTVRLFNETDIQDIANYFTQSPPNFLKNLGIDEAKLGTKSEFIDRYTEGLNTLAANNPESKIVTVFFKNEKIGFHTHTHYIPNESLILHGHYFSEKHRGKGIGPIAGIKAGELLFKKFNLKEIILKIPLQNKAPLKAVEKLGLTSEIYEVIHWPQLTGPMKTKVFHINYEMLLRLKEKFEI